MIKKKKLLDAVRKVKGEVIDKTSDVLAAPKIGYLKLKDKRNDDLFKMRREKRAAKELAEQGKNVSLEGKDHNDDLFRARMAAINEAFDKEEEKRKGN